MRRRGPSVVHEPTVAIMTAAAAERVRLRGRRRRLGRPNFESIANKQGRWRERRHACGRRRLWSRPLRAAFVFAKKNLGRRDCVGGARSDRGRAEIRGHGRGHGRGRGHCWRRSWRRRWRWRRRRGRRRRSLTADAAGCVTGKWPSNADVVRGDDGPHVHEPPLAAGRLGGGRDGGRRPANTRP